MIRLNMKTEPFWLEISGDVRLRLAPLTSTILAAARARPSVADLPPDVPNETVAVALAKEIAGIAVIEWEGIANEEGYPIPVSPEAAAAVIDLYPVYRVFQTEYLDKGLLLDSEKNASAPSPNGISSTRATDTATDAAPEPAKAATAARRS